MTFDQRVVHNHRGNLFARQGKKIPTAPKPTTTAPLRVTTTSTVVKPSVSASTVSRPAVSTSAPVSSSLSHSTISTLPVPPSTPSVTTPSTTSTITRAIPTSPVIPSTTLSTTSSSISTAPASTGGLSTGSLVGIIGGCICAIVVICLIVAFFLRRLRKQKTREGFDPTEFRRSAMMLDDTDEKAGLRPRPPTMIERRKVHAAHSDQVPAAPSTPSSLYENSEHGNQHPFAHYGTSSAQSYGALPPPAPPGGYSGIPGAYGVPPPLAPYNGAQYEQAGYGAPPVPGTYGPGAYAAYGLDPRYPQYQRQHQGYPHFSPNHQHSQRSQQQQTLADASTSSSSLSRMHQLTQSSVAPPAYADEDDSRWVAARSDIKPRPKEMGVSNHVGEQADELSSDSATLTSTPVSHPIIEAIDAPSSVRAKPNSTGPRPTSAYSLYDQDDVYGGM